ncbi:MAG: hypothetical protein ACYDFU_10275, partial [Nitrospirota bacterium]
LVNPVKDYLAAVSVGVVAGVPVLDLCYAEDSKAHVDMNVVRTGRGGFVELQGTAEGEPFSREQMDGLIELANKGIDQFIVMQREALGDVLAPWMVKV